MCVEQFPDEQLSDEFTESHHKISVGLSPLWFGFPVHRPRRYTVLLDKGTFTLRSEVTSESLVKQFGSRRTFNADDYFMGPTSLAVDFLLNASL